MRIEDCKLINVEAEVEAVAENYEVIEKYQKKTEECRKAVETEELEKRKSTRKKQKYKSNITIEENSSVTLKMETRGSLSSNRSRGLYVGCSTVVGGSVGGQGIVT